jgi:hypothetical protein
MTTAPRRHGAELLVFAKTVLLHYFLREKIVVKFAIFFAKIFLVKFATFSTQCEEIVL